MVIFLLHLRNLASRLSDIQGQHWLNVLNASLCLYVQILFQFRQLFKARLEPVPQANGVVRFYCDPTFWAKNVVNLGKEASYAL